MNSQKRVPVKAKQYQIKAGSGMGSIKTVATVSTTSVPAQQQLKPHLRYTNLDSSNSKIILLNTIIEEHLLKFGFIQTFDSFTKEAVEKAMSTSGTKERLLSPNELKAKLIETFKRGDDKLFLSIWTKLVTHKQLSDPDWQPNNETEIKARAHMALYHLNPNTRSKVNLDKEQDKR